MWWNGRHKGFKIPRPNSVRVRVSVSRPKIMEELLEIHPANLINFILENKERVYPNQWAFMLLFVLDNQTKEKLQREPRLLEFLSIVKENITKYQQSKS